MNIESFKDLPTQEAITALIATVAQLTEEIVNLKAGVGELFDITDELDQDLGELEKAYYELEDEDENNEYEMQCPHCQKTIIIDDEILDDGEAICPECEKSIDLKAMFGHLCGGDCDCCGE